MAKYKHFGVEMTPLFAPQDILTHKDNPDHKIMILDHSNIGYTYKDMKGLDRKRLAAFWTIEAVYFKLINYNTIWNNLNV